jgi:iron(III) transport system substrate-binding protein
MKSFFSKAAVWAAAALALAGCAGKGGEQAEADTRVVNVYSHRHYPSDQELFDRFEQQTGIKVNVVKAEADQLMQRMLTEGERCPADVLLTVDAGRLYRAKAQGLLQAATSPLLEQQVPAAFRDKDGMWVGMTVRARLIAYAKGRVQPEALSTYEALTEPAWKGRVLVRQSSNIYNQSLLAAMIASQGEEAAKAWAAGMVANMAREPKGSDRDQMKEVVKGTGDVAIVNSYYVGLLLTEGDSAEKAVGEQIGVFFPNQGGRGAHINISGAGVAKHSPNREHAIKFLEFLTGAEAQQVFASVNHEYPVNPAVQPSALLQSWGQFKADTADFERMGALNADAVRIFDEAGWK